MSIQSVWQESFSFPSSRTIVVEPSQAQLSSDAGLLPFRQFDQIIGLTQSFADALDDHRDPELVDHTLVEMVRARVYGILAGYEDQNDHDTLRDDPIFKMVAGRCPDEEPLASQPTLSRFENSINVPSLKRLRDVFIDQFIASFEQSPRRLTFDLDAVDDAAHGSQQLTFWHNYYDQNQYLPLLITCAENDELVMLSLRHGSAHAALGAEDDLAYLVNRLRAVWPDVIIAVRADSAFGMPKMYDMSEALRITYTFGLTTNAVLKRRSEELLTQALAAWEKERQAARDEQRPPRPVRLFDGFWYRAQTWPSERWVVVKAEANSEGSQRRFVVTNRPGAVVLPEGTYDDYAMRGESENRNKEFKCDLAMDRLSDHRFVANYFRLYLHAAALNLLVRMRRLVALPALADALPAAAGTPADDDDALPDATVTPANSDDALPETTVTSASNGDAQSDAMVTPVSRDDASAEAPVAPVSGDDARSATTVAPANNDSPLPVNNRSEKSKPEPIPTEALIGKERSRHFRQRRQRDPLGEGHPRTWRLLFIKVAAEVRVSSRRIVVRLSASWPHLPEYRRVCERLRALPPPTLT